MKISHNGPILKEEPFLNLQKNLGRNAKPKKGGSTNLPKKVKEIGPKVCLPRNSLRTFLNGGMEINEFKKE